MKKIYILIIIVITVGILLAGVGAIMVFGGPDKSFLEKTTPKNIDISASLSEVHLDLPAREVFIGLSQTDELSIKYHEINEGTYNYSHDGEVVRFSVESSFSFIDSVQHMLSDELKQVRILLPGSFQGKLFVNVNSGEINIANITNMLDLLEVSFTSGEFNATNINANSVDLSYLSGECDFSNSNIHNFSVDMRSGSIDIDNTKLDSLKIDASSGDVELSRITSKSSTVNIGSGDFDCENSNLGVFTFDKTSGKAEIENIEFISFDCSLTSGSIEVSILGIPENYLITGSVTSGRIEIYENDFNLFKGKSILYGSGEKQINVTAVSGNIEITFETYDD